MLVQAADEAENEKDDDDQYSKELHDDVLFEGLKAAVTKSTAQYSAGSRIVVADRSASVMIQMRTPVLRRYAERMRSKMLTA